MQHKVLAAATALTAAGLVASAGGPWAQIRRPPLPASAAAQTGSSGLPAREAAYGQTAGQGREDTPSTTEAPSSSFGRPNPGRPVFEDPDYRGGEGATGAPRFSPPTATVPGKGRAAEPTGAMTARTGARTGARTAARPPVGTAPRRRGTQATTTCSRWRKASSSTTTPAAPASASMAARLSPAAPASSPTRGRTCPPPARPSATWASSLKRGSHRASRAERCAPNG